MASNALIIQCFAKPDTLDGLLQSLLTAADIEKFHLIFWRDLPKPDASGDRLHKTSAVTTLIEDFAARHRSKFASTQIHANQLPTGTCATCKASIDFAARDHDFIVFSEDDTVFSKDALIWLLKLSETDLLDRPDVLALAGESIYFDAREKSVSGQFRENAIAYAKAHDLASTYVDLKFMPSTFFATTAAKWRIFAEMRGGKTGAADLAIHCKNNNIGAIFPVVPRIKDIGMTHPDGYSVATRGGAQNVEERKNTYLTSDDLPSITGALRPFDGDRDNLFWRSTMLNGFS
jgi:hypothetical protein